MEFRKDINGLRAIAVISVVLYHFHVPHFDGGFVGVDVFFVISGFLLTSIAHRDLEQGTYSAGKFLLNRVRRIFPALAVIAILCLTWAGWSYLPGDYNRLVRNATSVFAIRSNYAFLGDTGYFAPDAQLNILLHTWSLSVESQFYVVFALLCGVFWPHGSASRRKAGTALFAAVGCASLAWCVSRTPTNQLAAFYLLWGRAWEFMAGSIVAIYGTKGQRHIEWSGATSIGGVALLVCSIYGIGVDGAYPGWHAIIPVTGAALVIYSRHEMVTKLLSVNALQFIGRISYSVYLWHWPLIVAFREQIGKEPSAMQTVALIVASLFLGWVSYVLIEQPTRRRARNSALLGALIFSLAVGYAFTAVLSATNGWPQRLPNYMHGAVLALGDSDPRASTCMRRVDNTKGFQGDFCRIGVDAANVVPSVMLWGDSFAARMQPIVDLSASRLGMAGIVATEGGCPPFRGPVFKGSGAEVFPGCEKYSNFVFDYFLRNRSITLVVVAGDWQRYEPEHEGAMLKQIAQVLLERGGQMVLVSAVPNPREDVPHQWARRQFQAGHAIENWGVPRDAQADIVQRGSRIVEIAREAGNVIVVDPFKALCTSTVCYSVKDGKALFVDTDHLSKAGLMYLQSAVDVAVQVAHERGNLKVP